MEADTHLSKKRILQIAREREAKLLEHLITLRAHSQAQLDGMTRLLGCILDRHGEMDFTHAELKAMNPGRMYIADHDDVWHVRIRKSAEKPVEYSLVPENMPEEALDTEAMARDGVSEVKFRET
jgi:hypothetical protein